MNGQALVLASAAALALALPLAACDRSGGFRGRQPQAASETPDPGYRAAPQVSRAKKAADGAVTLVGRALPSSQVRLFPEPAGAPIETRADGSGTWSVPIGPVSEPTLYRLAEQAGNQSVEAEGKVVVLPGAPTVALLRAGSGAEVVQDAGKGPLRILAVDHDSAGGTVVSGRAPGPSPVRVLIDGQPAIEGAAGSDGRFSLTLPKPLPTGRHQVQVQTPEAAAAVDIAVTPPAAPKDASYQARLDGGGWRVDWITAGGGAQTTQFPAAPGPAAQPPAG